MAVAPRYDEFGSGGKKPLEKPGKRLSDAEIEDLKLTAFEQGFAAGWDDAVKAHADGQEKQDDEILEALRDSGFTLHEARRGLIDALSPLFVELSSKLLPSMAKVGLVQHVAEQLKQLTASSLDLPLELEISPESAAKLEELVGNEFAAQINILPVEDGELLAARLRVGRQEREIDMSRLVVEIEAALSGALHNAKQEMPDG